MTKPKWVQKTGATPGKLALVGVLAVVLVGVIVRQLPDSSPSPAIALNRTATAGARSSRPIDRVGRQRSVGAPAPTGAKSDSSESTPTEQPARVWPKVTLESAVLYDPMAMPAWLVAAQRVTSQEDRQDQRIAEAERQRRRAEVLEQLQQLGTKAVVFSAGEKRAIIGEHPVYIGDRIEGFQITDITKEGVVVTETH